MSPLLLLRPGSSSVTPPPPPPPVTTGATEDELRAEQWQRDHAAGCAARAAREARLHGSSSARHQLEKDWDPLYQWQREQGIQEPVDECDC